MFLMFLADSFLWLLLILLLFLGILLAVKLFEFLRVFFVLAIETPRAASLIAYRLDLKDELPL